MEESTWWKRWHEGLRGARVVSHVSLLSRIFTGLCGSVSVWFVGCVVFLLGVGLLLFVSGMVL